MSMEWWGGADPPGSWRPLVRTLGLFLERRESIREIEDERCDFIYILKEHFGCCAEQMDCGEAEEGRQFKLVSRV